jgi:NAD(P)-dependent dehydrogenase (short-subunit alcohol dehydrogenase family)
VSVATGGAAGTGRAVAEVFASEGAAVIFADIDAARWGGRGPPVSAHYHACPERSHAPGRAFSTHLEALRWAREASERYGVAYAVWRVLGGRLTVLERVSPGQARA